MARGQQVGKSTWRKAKEILAIVTQQEEIVWCLRWYEIAFPKQIK